MASILVSEPTSRFNTPGVATIPTGSLIELPCAGALQFGHFRGDLVGDVEHRGVGGVDGAHRDVYGPVVAHGQCTLTGKSASAHLSVGGAQGAVGDGDRPHRKNLVGLAGVDVVELVHRAGLPTL